VLNGKKFLITAGPTWEAIDPVRGITNHSSGKMGYAIAQSAFALDAEVKLISGPVCLSPPIGVETIQVLSAQDMFEAVHRQLESQDLDVFIGVAAVADYRPEHVPIQKIKKSSAKLTLELVKNPDIVSSVARMESGRPYTVAFAAETENLQANALKKLVNKKLDMIIANDVSKLSIGFGTDQNQVLMITRDQTIDSGIQKKTELAHTILQHIFKHL
jgi:phosphopantothenoylcysteine decarboxylase/phosphopantothenate--cysteine ligase